MLQPNAFFALQGYTLFPMPYWSSPERQLHRILQYHLVLRAKLLEREGESLEPHTPPGLDHGDDHGIVIAHVR